MTINQQQASVPDDGQTLTREFTPYWYGWYPKNITYDTFVKCNWVATRWQ